MSTMCPVHERQLHRDGAVGQTRVLRRELKTMLDIVRDTRDRNPQSPLWEALRDRWRGEYADAYRGVEKVQRGLPEQKYVRVCNETLVRIGDDLGRSAKDIDLFLDHLLSIVMLAQFDPRRFKSDEAVWVQVARLARSFDKDRAVSSRWDNTKQKQIRRYRTMFRPAAVFMGKVLMKLVMRRRCRSIGWRRSGERLRWSAQG